MTVTKIIRYTTRPECAAENEQLIRAVFAEFQRGIGGRCADGPAAADADLIGSYRLPLPGSG